MQNEILLEHILVETEGERVGQINAQSVMEFPSHLRAFIEPSRITCVVYIGNGEFPNIKCWDQLVGGLNEKIKGFFSIYLPATRTER